MQQQDERFRLPRMATEEQKRRFGQALRTERDLAGLSLAEIDAINGLKGNGSSAQQWEAGKTAPGDPEKVFRIEAALNLPPGRLSRALGYLPLDALDQVDIVALIRDDPNIVEEHLRQFAITTYLMASTSMAANAAKVPAVKSSKRRSR